MKTLMINCSPKKRLSASAFILDLTGLFMRGNQVKDRLRTGADHRRLLAEMETADNVLFAMPLYVDGVPAHVLPFLQAMEAHCRARDLKKNIYVIANNGFIEGRQNEPLFQIMENFSRRSGLNWCGGLGIGGGVMMNVMRMMVMVFFAISLLNLIIGGVQDSLLQTEAIRNLTRQVLVLIVLGSGILAFDIRLATCLNRGKAYGTHYTRILLPSFIFILCADIFFVIISLFQGGLFRGWLAKKKPTAGKPV
ncbi:hypothetical protein ACKQTC_04055 [Peptococcus simiae]|uniref:Uncharacterized protein n=1 Tax=Peptococcus simiae TaxID=1643805 RepID=A0ABW9GZS8_9FIRM